MAYDSVTTAAVAVELRQRLLYGRVDKVIQPSELGVALFLRAGGANHTLLLSAHPQQGRVALTSERLAKAFDEPSAFVMLLRKHLEGASVTEIAQVGRDRIIRLSFRAHPAPVSLVAEVMGKHSNVILVDEKDTILGAVKRISATQSRYRTVLPHHPYILPPAPLQPPPREREPKLDPLATTPQALAEALRVRLESDPGATLAGALLDALTGVSPQLTREVAYRLMGDTNARLGESRENASLGAPSENAPLGMPGKNETLGAPGEQEQQAACLLAALRALMAPERWEPSIARRDGKLLGWAAYPLLQHGVAPAPYPSMATVLDLVYGGVESGDPLGSSRDRLRAAIAGHRARASKKAQSLRAGLRPREEIDAWRMGGEMVLAFAHEIAPGQRELRLEDPEITVPLDPTLTPSENAQALFARYRKARDAAEKVPPMLDAVEEDLQFLDAALLFVEQAGSARELKEIADDVAAAGFGMPGEKTARTKAPKPGKGGKYHPGGKKEPPGKTAAPALRWRTHEGLEVLVGRSARQNEVVTFDLASSGDLWFHARGMPGSHVVLKTAGRAPSEESVEQAAALAAYYSRGRGSTTVPVDVVPARSVRRVKGGKPGLVRISGETTITVRPRPEP